MDAPTPPKVWPVLRKRATAWNSSKRIVHLKSSPKDRENPGLVTGIFGASYSVPQNVHLETPTGRQLAWEFSTTTAKIVVSTCSLGTLIMPRLAYEVGIVAATFLIILGAFLGAISTYYLLIASELQFWSDAQKKKTQYTDSTGSNVLYTTSGIIPLVSIKTGKWPKSVTSVLESTIQSSRFKPFSLITRFVCALFFIGDLWVTYYVYFYTIQIFVPQIAESPNNDVGIDMGSFFCDWFLRCDKLTYGKVQAGTRIGIIVCIIGLIAYGFYRICRKNTTLSNVPSTTDTNLPLLLGNNPSPDDDIYNVTAETEQPKSWIDRAKNHVQNMGSFVAGSGFLLAIIMLCVGGVHDQFPGLKGEYSALWPAREVRDNGLIFTFFMFANLAKVFMAFVNQHAVQSLVENLRLMTSQSLCTEIENATTMFQSNPETNGTGTDQVKLGSFNVAKYVWKSTVMHSVVCAQVIVCMIYLAIAITGYTHNGIPGHNMLENVASVVGTSNIGTLIAWTMIRVAYVFSIVLNILFSFEPLLEALNDSFQFTQCCNNDRKPSYERIRKVALPLLIIIFFLSLPYFAFSNIDLGTIYTYFGAFVEAMVFLGLSSLIMCWLWVSNGCCHPILKTFDILKRHDDSNRTSFVSALGDTHFIFSWNDDMDSENSEKWCMCGPKRWKCMIVMLMLVTVLVVAFGAIRIVHGV